ncbi:MBL fold metallo-hydrolase [Ramlibacter alkalitolerans]|uniref:MBL fold metallo-hydrolase n=1 Tax=Ramlibacter alkalitolerans TaxID=2039631 RepID=A0ABS1JVE4_9BURK|nr:MBL fold metallo-hydrolase [Ramlibacter alkalitolerans]MBL0428188.1 MBL fold metallo-hydrolase [Ramlibacter alkalitolerans]
MTLPQEAGDERLAHGITVVDTGFVRPRFDAAYLVVEEGRAAVIDTGTNAAVPRILAALAAQGLEPAQVDWVIPTHIHLDHAGGAGLLMQQLPNARLLVHPRGARHMVDPSQLMAGVRAVYGEEAVRRDYGELVPVPAQRVLAAEDGMVVHLAQRPLRLLDTPGHARHHLCVWDEASGGCFTGDTLGVSYREFHTARWHYALPSSSPVQYDPVALHASVARLLSLRPALAFITHYGAVAQVEAQADMVLRQSDAMAALAQRLRDAPDFGPRLRDGLRRIYLAEARSRKVGLGDDEILQLVQADVELNAQGLAIWLGSGSAPAGAAAQ